MATDDRHMDVAGLDASDLMDELVGSNHIQSSDANDLLGVKPVSPVDLAHGRHHRVHRIHDQSDHSAWAELCAGLHQVLGDAEIDLQEVRSVHARLSGNSSRNQDQIGAHEALLE
eukprot:CAMPEP_0195006314 /NCGR_PEP_ID=MMETSP0326_2-20130528/6570_1 /TAXON_ID=2866 ORGANISM="Crypthecodinium cohnii, Strain Seligo" /NCGR_SAMPLE_ID=MMETSP0326_2 /ASSEMBLY_ACC=CAM_ASM_000348 /LENGTH=114 /DNA_ID=CAMNT_0040013001 /DNA_START=309 /DNA_END=650 /DNA_ORIENTATION=-